MLAWALNLGFAASDAAVAPVVALGASPDRASRSRHAIELDAERERTEQEDHLAAHKKAIEQQRPKPVAIEKPVKPEIEAPYRYGSEIPVTISKGAAIKPVDAAKQAPSQTDETLAEDVAKLRAALEATVGALTDAVEAQHLKQQQRRRVALALILAAAA
jgi:hypothetical protein